MLRNAATRYTIDRKAYHIPTDFLNDSWSSLLRYRDSKDVADLLAYFSRGLVQRVFCELSIQMNDRHAIELARSSLRRAIASIPDDEYRFSRYAQGLLKASLQSFLELRDASKKRPSIAGKGKSSSPRHPKPDTAIVPGPETFDVTREHYDAVLRNLPLEDQALLHRCMDGQTANQIAYTTKQSVRAINKQLSQILAGLANAFSRSE